MDEVIGIDALLIIVIDGVFTDEKAYPGIKGAFGHRRFWQ